jgi:hypothetical protein
MAINIGNDAKRAIENLRGNVQFEDFVSALGIVAQSRYLAAMNSSAEHRVDQTSHARGVYEVWEAIHADYMGIKPGQPNKQPVPKTRLEKVENGA